MTHKMGWALIFGGVFVLAIFVIHSAITGLIVAVDTDQLANVLVGYIACLVLGSLVTIGLITYTSHRTERTCSPPLRGRLIQ